jgi:predicted DCC family thiol-disulfide oxidoreductase YuxK
MEAPSAADERHDPRLVDPDNCPGADVVIFDGKCRFCRAQVVRLARWDRRKRLAFLSLHDPRVHQRYPDLSHEQLMEQMYVIESTGRRHAGAAAFRYLTRRLPRLFPLAPLMHLPLTLPLWQWCYRQVARRRYRIAGKSECADDACKVHYS